MTSDNNPAAAWRRAIALFITSIIALASLVGTRGPDSLGFATAEATGTWLLSGPTFWNPLTLFSSATRFLYFIAGLRAWQNAHVTIAWITILCWLFTLPPKSWRGLLPVIPTLFAVILSNNLSGLSGFGTAILVLSMWRAIFFKARPALLAASLVVVSWIAIWLAPEAIFLIVAIFLEALARVSRKYLTISALFTLVCIHLTPRGFSFWNESRIFSLWSPQPSPDAAALIAIAASIVVLALVAHKTWNTAKSAQAFAPAFLFLCATQGQSAFLWPAALFMIPCWSEAKEELVKLGFKIRWWMQSALLIGSICLALWVTFNAMPRWFNLAMNPATIQPSLTYDALPKDGIVFINRAGLPLARFAGPFTNTISIGDKSHPQLAREPSLWRASDRRERYRAVWLLGDKSSYAPLARHLGESPDWRLVSIDPSGVLFERLPREPEFATEPAQQFARSMIGAANRANFLAATTLSALAANAIEEADELSIAAVRRSDRSSFAATSRTLTLISLGQAREALDESQRALHLDPDSADVWRVRTEALLHAGQTDAAYAASTRAAELAPGDTGTLWLAARAANAARAFQSEAEILERLIALTQGRGGDANFYRFYLGQSYAKQGLLRPALNALEAAAQAPGITKEQQKDIYDEIESIKSSPGAR